MRTFTLTIEMENAAFEDEGAAVKEILAIVANKLPLGNLSGLGCPVLDLNGNWVGLANVSDRD
jgi:hypothetical protein